MKTFFALWCSLITAIVIDLIVFNIFSSVGILPEIGINVRGNIIFSSALALICILIGKSEALSRKALLEVIGFIMTCVALAWAAPYMMPHSLFLGMLMMSPLGVIGRYPPGADMDLSYGAVAWGLSALVPIGTGLLVMALLRRLMRGSAELR